MIEDRIRNLRDELNERNEEIDILKGEASEQINQIRGSITKLIKKTLIKIDKKQEHYVRE